jgi:hypothetical protein
MKKLLTILKNSFDRCRELSAIVPSRQHFLTNLECDNWLRWTKPRRVHGNPFIVGSENVQT